MPGLIRGVARTAVVAGTASAVAGRVNRRQQGRWAAQDAEQQAAEQRQMVDEQPEAAAPPQTDTNTKLAQLRQLGELHTSGVIDDAEFELQKSQILNS